MEQGVGGENSPSQFINNGSSVTPINLEDGGAINNGAGNTSEKC
jgi:hypothetical protein